MSSRRGIPEPAGSHDLSRSQRAAELRPASDARRTKLGATWWARKWVDALEARGWEARLQRGRSYARGGQVEPIQVAAGRIEARVKGSRPRPYRVKIELPPLSDATWERVIDSLAGQARYEATLLDGVMPQSIEEPFADAGAHLLPHPDEPLYAECSCPDFANPCKHIAAVHYVFGSELDRDPFLLFQLRGRTKDEIIGALRARRNALQDDAEVEPSADPTTQPSDLPLENLLDRFWTPGIEFGELRFAVEGPRVPEAVLKRLGSPTGSRGGKSIVTQLSRLYQEIGERAVRSAYEDVGEGGS